MCSTTFTTFPVWNEDTTRGGYAAAPQNWDGAIGEDGRIGAYARQRYVYVQDVGLGQDRPDPRSNCMRHEYTGLV